MGVLMGIVDFFPVCLFLAAAIIYQRALYNKMSKGAFALFAAGTIFTFVAGLFKATHKILYEAGICDFIVLSKCFFPMQTTGFVLAACGMVALLVYPQGEHAAYSIIPLPLIALLFAEAPKEYSGTMLFVVLMVLGVLIMDGSLCFIALKRKEYLIFVFLIVAFICTLGMGYLSTKPEISDWYKEIINTVGQGSFLISAILFKKHGLYDHDALKNVKQN